MNRTQILDWLREEDPQRLGELFQRADEVRRANVGDAVHLRGLIEIGSECSRSCLYCGLRKENHSLTRYRMTPDEIWECVGKAVDYGYGTVVLQAAEDPEIDAQLVAGIVRRIKAGTPLAVTLSLGEREEDFPLWREAGANRYLLRFETSDRSLYQRIHPNAPHGASDRIALLKKLKELGFETGGGVMIGIPGQSYDILADDLLMFRSLDLDMIGVGPYLPHPETPLGRNPEKFFAPEGQQTPNSEEMTYKVIALARILCPEANIPSTTALATVNTVSGRERGLQSGANVVMPNLTPPRYRQLYEIYPGKACVTETAEACRDCLRNRILGIGRTVGSGMGSRRHRDPVAQPA